MASKSSVLEQFFLRLFKAVILVVMTLALLTTVGALGLAAYQYFQAPQAPEPAQAAPSKGVDVDGFFKQLDKAPAGSQPDTTPAPDPLPSPDKYRAEATQIIECAKTYHTAIGQDTFNGTEEAVSLLRAQLARFADEKGAHRGAPYASDAVRFACGVLSHPRTVEYGKANVERDVYVKTLNFHVKAWDQQKASERAFNEKELARFDQQFAEEEGRIRESRQSAVMTLAIAGVAFTLMMGLALYLIFSAIESNLRRLSESVEAWEVRGEPRIASDDAAPSEPAAA